MIRSCLVVMAVGMGMLAAQAPARPYKVLKTAQVGGEGGWDYIYADPAGRRLYIPRGATSAADPASSRITIFNLDTLAPLGDIPDTGGQGVAVCPATGHGFASSHPQVTMFDTHTDKVMKKIDVGAARADGILCDTYNDRVYIFSHPTHNATVIDAKTGDLVGTIDLGGTPEEGVADGHGTLYDVMQDKEGGVAVVDVKAMKTVKHYSFDGNGGCNGLALDNKNHVLFAACRAPQPTMVILSATDGKILAKLPIAGGSDGAVFNPATHEAFSTEGNGMLTVIREESPTQFTVEQNLKTMDGARTITLDTKTNHILTMSQKFEPPPPQPAGAPAEGRRGYVRRQAVPGSFTILVVGR
ncbi:MAG TPA: hypothetical protein VIE13_02750 [Terriglobales bacterium]|jgi:hypothetical protein